MQPTSGLGPGDALVLRPAGTGLGQAVRREFALWQKLCVRQRGVIAPERLSPSLARVH
ncbi:MAG: hypothetical protein ACREFP_00575 [Acetobacteraceae bacterium]